MINIPNLPPKEELEYKQKEFLVSLNDQLSRTSKTWFFVLFAVMIVSLPVYFILRNEFAKQFISSYQPPQLTNVSFDAKPLEILNAVVLPVAPGIYSAHVQVFNPNTDLSARNFIYEFEFRDNNGKILKSVPGSSFLLSGKTSRIVLAAARLSVAPARVGVSITDTEVKWTKAVPSFEPDFLILQKSSGSTPEGNFFVEAQLKNNHSFEIKSVNIAIVVFDRQNENIVAVNSTVVTDLKPFESRYFRLIWPMSADRLFAGTIGQIEISPSLNPFMHGLR